MIHEWVRVNILSPYTMRKLNKQTFVFLVGIQEIYGNKKLRRIMIVDEFFTLRSSSHDYHYAYTHIVFVDVNF